MATIDDHVTTADGWFKDVFGDVLDVRPDGVRLLERLPFPDSNKTGQQHSEVVWLTEESGFTYHTGTSTGFALNASIVSESDEATLLGSEIVLRSQTSYKSFSNAVAGGPKAFGSFYKQKVKNMRKSHIKRMEISHMHGGRSLGTISSVSGSGTTRAWTMTVASWAPMIWAGSRNAALDCYLVSGPTQRNTNADVLVTSIDFTPTAPVINVSGNSTDLTACVAGDELYWKGSYSNEPTGIIGAVSNTGTYRGIDGTSYDLWTGNTVAVGSAALTWSKIQDGIEQAAGRGLDQDVCLFVSFPTWSDLNSDLSALRRIDSGYKTTKTSQGTRMLEYYSHTGTVEVVPSGYCKGGEAFFFPKGEVSLVGSTTQTFEIPGSNGGRYFEGVSGTAAIEMQSYSDCAPKLDAPSMGCLFTGIVNS